MNTAKVLLVDDDPQVRRALRTTLTSAGYVVVEARTGEEAIEEVQAEGAVDIVLLDLKMPGIGGLEACRRIRKIFDVSILVISVLRTQEDKVQAFDAGADDYLVKPFGTRELLARIRAVLRRTSDSEERHTENAAKTYGFSGWTLETARRRLLDPNGVEVAITGGEYDLLVALLDRPNRVLTRDMLLDLLRGRQAGPFDRAIDVAVSRLRRKLEDDGRNAQLIKTVRGGGYVLSTPVERH
jgi:two-component system OmpR family response regulator